MTRRGRHPSVRADCEKIAVFEKKVLHSAKVCGIIVRRRDVGVAQLVRALA